MTDTPAVWSFPMDWTNGYSETLEWKTAILTSQTGAEQRYAARLGPRRYLDLPFVVTGQERVYFDVMLMANGGRNWFVPLPHEVISVPPATAGQTLFYFDTGGREWRENGYAIVRGHDSFHFEVVQIILNAPTGLQVSPLVNDYALGCTITPAILARITDTVATKRYTGRVMSGTVRFIAVEPTYWPLQRRDLSSVPILGPPLWTGLSAPVLLFQPNAVDTLDYSYERMINTLDADAGLPSYVDTANRGFTTQTYSWFLNGVTERSNFRDLLFVLCGQRSPVWVPTFNDDLAPASGGGFPDPSHVLASVPGRTEEPTATFYRDGTVGYGHALSYGNAANNYVPPEIFDSANVARISFMSVKRLNTDSVEIMHNTDASGVATVTLPLRDAPDIRTPTGYTSVPWPANTGQLQSDGTTVQAVSGTSVLNAPATITGTAGGQTA